MTSLTLAAVVDLEAPATVRGRDTLRKAQARLDAVAERIQETTAVPIETVVLYGEPGEVLHQYATEHGYEVIVMGNRSASSSHLVRRRASHTSVPLLIGPAAG